MGLPLTGYGLRSYSALLAVGLISQAGGWLLISYALGYLRRGRDRPAQPVPAC
jgi:hypothetical protein